jgi:hypothetical protein
MIPSKFELHLAQAEAVLEISQSLKFSDPRKRKHLEQLQELFYKIKGIEYAKFSESELNSTRECIDYFILWDLEFLIQSSDNTRVPSQLLYCIEQALFEWLGKSEQYIIVTSLSKKFGSYSFQSISDSKLAILEPFIEKYFGIKFEHKLILINMPKPLVGDYLANVVLFHEIGHFIDRKNQIVQRIFDTEPQFKNLSNGSEKEKRQFSIIRRYYAEFFADLFAAQYIKNTCSDYLNYIAYKSPNSPTHPSTQDRILTVNNFINKIPSGTVSIIQAYTLSITGKSLEKRYEDISGEFSEGVILKISTENQLYTLFIKGWECWLNTSGKFPRQHDKGLLEGYKHLNSLIETSIQEFISSLSIPSTGS